MRGEAGLDDVINVGTLQISSLSSFVFLVKKEENNVEWIENYLTDNRMSWTCLCQRPDT